VQLLDGFVESRTLEDQLRKRSGLSGFELVSLEIVELAVNSERGRLSDFEEHIAGGVLVTLGKKSMQSRFIHRLA
jgi:hypothetical protein